MSEPTTRLEFECDDLDYRAIMRATAIMQSWGTLPDGGGDIRGRLIAEICRGWMDMAGIPIRPDDGRDGGGED